MESKGMRHIIIPQYLLIRDNASLSVPEQPEVDSSKVWTQDLTVVHVTYTTFNRLTGKEDGREVLSVSLASLKEQVENLCEVIADLDKQRVLHLDERKSVEALISDVTNHLLSEKGESSDQERSEEEGEKNQNG